MVTADPGLADTARATAEDDDRGRVELYADPAGVLVGAAAVGPGAEEWMAEVTLAVKARIPLSVLADVVHAFPAYGAAMEPALRELTAGGVPRDQAEGTTASAGQLTGLL